MFGLTGGIHADESSMELEARCAGALITVDLVSARKVEQQAPQAATESTNSLNGAPWPSLSEAEC